MHNCLKISEIVDLICSHSRHQPPWLRKSDRLTAHDLAAIARTCVFFEGPALDHLWNYADLARLLVYWMPLDLWTVDYDPRVWPKDNKMIIIKIRQLRAVQASDWDRLKLYLPRVKTLRSGMAGWDLSEIFPTLSVALPQTLFCDRNLHWRHTDDESHYVHPFLGPELTGIEIYPFSATAPSLLPTLTATCPISSCPDSDLPSLHASTLDHLSRSSTLTTLILHIAPTLPLALSGEPTFTSLRDLTLENATSTTFFSLCSEAPVNTLHISTDTILLTAVDVHALLTSIPAGVAYASLTELTFTGYRSALDTWNPAVHLVPPRFLHPIFDFFNPTQLIFYAPIAFDPIRAHHPRTTIGCLRSFAEHCPYLRDLKMVFDGTIVPSPRDVLANDVVQRSLVHLNVTHSPISAAASRVFSTTSTVFLDPALNGLWRQQGTIVNLLRVMPTDLWEIPGYPDEVDANEDEETGDAVVPQESVAQVHEELNDHPREKNGVSADDGSDDGQEEYEEEEFELDDFDPEIRLRRPIIASDWGRFCFYAPRVRCFSNEGEILETAQVYEGLTQYFPEAYIFPRLEKLIWNRMVLVNGQFSRQVRFFLTPGMTKVDFAIHWIPDIALLPTIARTCPRLTEVWLCCTAEAMPLISEFVCALHHLETLVGASMAHIARLPRLRHLQFRAAAEPIIFLPHPDSQSVHFPALKMVEFDSFEHAPALLDLLPHCSLLQFSIIGFSVPPTKIMSHQFYASLARNGRHSSLQELRVQNSRFGPFQNFSQIRYSVDKATLEPLLDFPNLVVLWLCHPGGFDLDDTMVEKMASAWPRIEILQLSSDRSCRLVPRITLEEIYAFATHCPHLEHLAIAFDATVIPDLQINGAARVTQRRLLTLVVEHLPIEDPLRVARLLRTLFPRLRTLSADSGLIDAALIARHDAWRQVEENLR
ncbi:hypothetical protein C8R46DRAFT_1276078 [Mycena filopes]|nr:hypothetical protein C8R46DRAFT_1276078 [Mycena filopes]